MNRKSFSHLLVLTSIMALTIVPTGCQLLGDFDRNQADEILGWVTDTLLPTAIDLYEEFKPEEVPDEPSELDLLRDELASLMRELVAEHGRDYIESLDGEDLFNLIEDRRGQE